MTFYYLWLDGDHLMYCVPKVAFAPQRITQRKMFTVCLLKKYFQCANSLVYRVLHRIIRSVWMGLKENITSFTKQIFITRKNAGVGPFFDKKKLESFELIISGLYEISPPAVLFGFDLGDVDTDLADQSGGPILEGDL